MSQKMSELASDWVNSQAAIDQGEARETRKHTAGPWTITGTNNSVVIGNDKRKTIVAHVQWPADARLIAAAPELLEALADIEALMTKLGQDICSDDTPAWWRGNVIAARNKAIIAIQKARGA